MKRNFTLVCLNCGSSFEKKHPYPLWRYRKFRFCGNKCSHIYGNSGRFKDGHPGLRNEKNHVWKADGAGYRAIHSWVKRRIKKQTECEFCGKQDRIITDSLGREKSYLQLANMSGEYKRDTSDWKYLCPPCHCKYDSGRDSIRKVFLEEGRAKP